MPAYRRARPAADEFASFYAGYLQQVPDGDVVEALIGGAEIAAALLHDVHGGGRGTRRTRRGSGRSRK